MTNLLLYGTGPLVDRLRTGVVAEVPSAVIVPDIDGERSAVPVHELDDNGIEELFEVPMTGVIRHCQDAFHRGSRRLVIIVPTTAMSGGSHFAAVAALAEAARVLVKSAARQWGQMGIAVNAVAVEPRWFTIDGVIAGPVSIAAPALLTTADLDRLQAGESPNAVPALDPVPLVTWLCSTAAGNTTGQTIVCDGGQWM